MRRDMVSPTRFRNEDKGQCQMWHFKKRLRERLGIKISDDDYKRIVSVLKNGKEDETYSFKYIHRQSQRLKVYELTIKGYEPVEIIYDNNRKQIITVMFPTDGKEFNSYYDVFNNKINIRDKFGLNFGWKYDDGQLKIPNATVVKNGDIFECTEGHVKGMRFKVDNDALVEVM